MTIKNENKFKDIIGELKGLNRISAEEGLKENILKLSNSFKDNRFSPRLMTVNFAFYILIFILLAGSTSVVASQKSKNFELINSVKENIVKLSKPTLKEDYQVFDSNEEAITPSQTPTLSEDKANIDEENIDKEIASDSSDKKNGQKDSNQDIKGISAENQEHAETAIQNALLVVPNEATETLNDVLEKITGDDNLNSNQEDNVNHILTLPVPVDLDIKEKLPEMKINLGL